ncbi:IS21 family transposase [Colwellia hornerae]|uniref:IS21 family transposase n=1 Tax=Colwellia hornerae TaxID=89402 RepID=A0A5C6QGD7_9GAMM|nr:IS21 family transposase [Colwellia hornerae]TWX55256.1 IS21 family transposase [Colwellia hornerae]TWX61256.1 IS21 family transposase [Colwellia hornerae]TWX67697.1 IS21 family transposase [Colwellia hornerae]
MHCNKTPIKKVTELLRLKFEVHLSHRKIAKNLEIGVATVSDVLNRFSKGGVGWSPLITESQLEEYLYPNRLKATVKLAPDMGGIHQQLKRQGMTKKALWQKYREEYQEQAYGFTQFCERYNRWLVKQKPSIRQSHQAGDVLLVSYVSPDFAIVNPDTGELREVIILVASLGASNYTYSEAIESNDIESGIMAIANALTFFGGTPSRTLVYQQASFGRNTPSFNKNYLAIANFYCMSSEHLKLRSGQTKRNIDISLRVVTRWILSKIRSVDFYTLESLNTTLSQLSKKLNQRVVKSLPESRSSLFELLDQPVLEPLPDSSYLYIDYRTLKAGINHHVCYKKHYYSIPVQYHGAQLDIQATASSVKIHHCGRLITQHSRKHKENGFSTIDEHMPTDKEKYKWSPKSILRSSKKIGSSTSMVIDEILRSTRHPEQSYLTCFGINNLAKQHSCELLELACKKAHYLDRINRKVIEQLIKTELSLEKH